jgi:peptidyl-prolyl cis-trans isomerase SurA
MKNIRFVLPFLIAPLFMSAQDKAVIDRVVATVGGEIILLSEVQDQYAYAKQSRPKLTDDYRCEVVQNLIVQKLLVNQAKLDSIKMKDEEVETQLNARIERMMKYFNQDSKAIEEYYGQTIDQIKEQTRSDMRNQILAEKMQAQITAKATVTPAEVLKFYKNIPKDSLPYFNAEVEIREIVYKPQFSAAEKLKARTKIDDLRKRITEGKEDFGAIAKKFSDDPGSGGQGGDLGFQKRGTFVPEFEATAYKLEKGEISQVVETPFGFHIIQLVERHGNLIHTRHILVKPEITDADLERAKLKLDTVRQLIKDGKITFGEAVKKYGEKNTQSYNNDGIVANGRTGNSFHEVGDLDPDIYFAIEKIQVGDIAEPLSIRSEDGSRLYKLIMLQSRSKPHKADLKLDYGKIQQAALDQKKSESSEKWVLEKLRSTYLSVSDMFRSCPNLKEMMRVKG